MRRAARRKKAFRPRKTLPGQGAAPNLIKELEPSAPDQVWASDITYVSTLEGWLYLAVILDLFQPESGRLETERELGGRTGCYGAQKCFGFAPAG
jgi:transposase InsO family protein